MAPLEAIKWEEDGVVQVLDQLKLPTETVYIRVSTVEEGWSTINKMQVRGAPAIAMVGCLSLAAELRNSSEAFAAPSALHAWVTLKLTHLIAARPTAVNMKTEASRLQLYLPTLQGDVGQQKEDIVRWCVQRLEEDVKMNKRLGEHGTEAILEAAKTDGPVSLITICNTGALATAGHGTALGVARSLHARGRLGGITMLETRPYLQGARLSALEAVAEGWPSARLICDGAAAAWCAQGSVGACVVGADRVARNGDTANKIGTLQLALTCRHFCIPFFVCAPSPTIDPLLATGALIPIEQRPPQEMTFFNGKQITPQGIDVWNPAFDVTPANLITGIVTERGVFPPALLSQAIDEWERE